MFDWLSSLWDGASGAVKSLGSTDTMKGLGGLGQFAGGLGQAYGAYNQSKVAKDAINFEKQQYGDYQNNLNTQSNNLGSAVDANFNTDGTPKKKSLGSYAGA
jgi:hypothetical protein